MYHKSDLKSFKCTTILEFLLFDSEKIKLQSDASNYISMLYLALYIYNLEVHVLIHRFRLFEPLTLTNIFTFYKT